MFGKKSKKDEELLNKVEIEEVQFEKSKYDDHKLYKNVKFVNAFHKEYLSILRTISATLIGGVIGKGSSLYNSVVEKAIRETSIQLIKNALKANPNVVAIKQTSLVLTTTDMYIECVMSGTAVVKIEEDNKKNSEKNNSNKNTRKNNNGRSNKILKGNQRTMKNRK
jgi:hypothetical protein